MQAATGHQSYLKLIAHNSDKHKLENAQSYSDSPNTFCLREQLRNFFPS